MEEKLTEYFKTLVAYDKPMILTTGMPPENHFQRLEDSYLKYLKDN